MPAVIRKASRTLDTFPVMSLLIVILAVVGGVVTITSPDRLSFVDYFQTVIAGAAALGIGRGIAALKR
jgi:hypothetical protein